MLRVCLTFHVSGALGPKCVAFHAASSMGKLDAKWRCAQSTGLIPLTVRPHTPMSCGSVDGCICVSQSAISAADISCMKVPGTIPAQPHDPGS